MNFGCWRKTGMLAVFGMVLTVSGAGQPTVIPFIGPIELDGSVAGPEWSRAWHGELRTLGPGKVPSEPTAVWAGRDADNLYIAFDCRERAVKQMRRKFQHAEERDNAIYSDDCVEIFINPFGSDSDGLYHFAVNADGIVYDALSEDTGFNSGIRTACKVYDDHWVAEVAIPLADLSMNPGGAELWRFNFGRERQGKVPEYSSWGMGSGGFSDPSRLKEMRLAGTGVAPGFAIRELGSGPVRKLVMANVSGDRKIRRIQLELQDAAGKKLRDFQSDLKPGAPLEFEYRTKLPNGDVKLLLLKVFPEKSEEPEYRNAYALNQAVTRSALTMTTPSPLFKELWSDKLNTEFPFAAIVWPFGLPPFDIAPMQTFALQFGLEYRSDEFEKEMADARWGAYYNSVLCERLLSGKSLDVRMPPLIHRVRILDEELPGSEPHNVFVLPEVRKKYLEKLSEIKQFTPYLKAVCWGDENSEQIEKDLVEFAARHSEHPGVKAIDAAIKSRYGHGKYGIPSSEHESDPAAWIAFRRWLNDELVSVYREAYKLVKSINPAIVVISDDPIDGQNTIYSFSDWSGTFDIATRQLYPSRSPVIDSFGFATKYVADLTGAENMWPCPHVEEYGASFTPDEVLEELSAAIRGGATGFHWYLDDTQGRRSGKKYLHTERYGAPERYQAEMAATRTLNAMPYLARPEDDCAVFTGTDALRGYCGLAIKGTPRRDVHLHGFLAYGAGVWYKFINENTLKNLNRYRFIASIENEFVAPEAVAALRKYVEDGGTLLLLNPAAFTRMPDGGTTDRKFTGIKSMTPCRDARNIVYGKLKLPVSGLNAATLSPEAGAKVIGIYDNGSAAVIENHFGKGKVITFGVCPGDVKLAGDTAWRNFFREFAAGTGAQTGQDIWRFRLPSSLLVPPPELVGVCLTGNAGYWRKFEFQSIPGGETEGSYRVTPAPMAGDPGNTAIPFAKGRLTDRPRAVQGGNIELGKSGWGDWIDAWKNTAIVTVDFTFAAPVTIRTIKLWSRGTWTKAVVIVNDAAHEFPFRGDPAEVCETVLTLPEAATAAQWSVRLEGVSGTLDIGEMELWQ